MERLELQLQALAAQTEVRTGRPRRFCPWQHQASNYLIDCAGAAEQTGRCQVATFILFLLLLTAVLAASTAASLSFDLLWLPAVGVEQHRSRTVFWLRLHAWRQLSQMLDGM